MENTIEVPQKIKNEPYDPATLLLGIWNENTNSKIYTHPHAHCSIIYNSQDIEITYVHSWMNG